MYIFMYIAQQPRFEWTGTVDGQQLEFHNLSLKIDLLSLIYVSKKINFKDDYLIQF